ncbi:MAG: metal-dependent transcriptional regulator [Methanomicrobium sp.]|nr:metal-dependent transcriptional regulator [Methanomicrobium sp.]MDD4299447.1 metal-dependent transcriptional regulator [Methanomicrobium sp.]
MQPDECEDYLETIINNSISDLKNESLRILTQASEKNMKETEKDLHELQRLGYISIEKDGSITLTELGKRTGECTIKKHKVLESFLTEMLGMEPDTASKEACILEHGASDDTIKRLKKYLHGHGRCRRREEHERHAGFHDCCGKPLTDFFEEEVVRILCTKGGAGRTNRLHDLGVIPGEIININRKLSNGAMVVTIKSCEVGLSPEIAASVFAEKI